MVNDIVLGSALRENLQSINTTQRALDRTTLRLATGLEVNSALDNPQNFFAASSLDSRANDLQRLLDGIGLGIQTVKEAETGVEALTSLITQADSIASQAVELNAQSPTEAKVTSSTDLRAAGILTSLPGINAGNQIQIFLRDPDIILPYFPPASTVTINAGDTVDSLVANINALNNGFADPVIRARVTENGALEIAAIAGHTLNIEFVAAIGNDAANLALAQDLGFGDFARLYSDGFGTNEVQFSVVASRTLTSFQLFNAATNQTAVRSDRISQIEGANNTLLFFGLNSLADFFEIGVNNGSRQSIQLDATQTIQGLIDEINNNPNLNTRIEADFNEETGQLLIRAIDPEVETIETGLVNDLIAVAFFGFNVSIPLSIFGNTDVDSILLGSAGGPAASQINALEKDFNKVLRQIDNIAADAHFRGVNLLEGDQLEIFFNEDRSNSLVINGVDFTASGLGFSNAVFDTLARSQISVDSARNALELVRDFGQSISNSLSVIQNRRDFAEKTINTLESGADDLTVADLNEEGSNLLAVQTRQTLALTVLTLVAQQQSAILRIF